MSIVLDGATQYAKKDSITLAYPFSVSIWFKSDSLTASQVAAAFENGPNLLNLLQVAGGIAGDPVRAMTYQSAWTTADTPVPYTTGVWHNAVAVFNSATDRRIYLDGGNKDTDATNQNASVSTVVIGAYKGGTLGFFDGKLAEFAVWNVALSDADALALATVTPPSAQPTGLVHYLPLAADANDDVGDWNLTTYGSPTFDGADVPPVGRIVNAVATPFPVTQLEDIPEPKEQHGFEELNGKLYAVCGITTGSLHSNKVYAYNVASGHWEAKADAPLSMQSPVLRAVNGKLYLIGGYRSDLSLKYDTCYEYDPDADTWTEKAHMPYAREDHGSAVVNGEIWIFGGLMEPAHTMVPWIDVFNPATNTWRSSIAWATPRALGDYCCSYRGKIYVVSSTPDMSGYSGDLKATQDVEEYDPVANTWTRKTDIPIAVCYKEIVEIDGQLYIVSGATASTTTFTPTYQVFDVALNKWKQRRNLVPFSVRGAGMAVYNGSVYYCGGFTVADNQLADLYRFTPNPASSMSGASGTAHKAIPVTEGIISSIFNIPSDLESEEP